MSDLFTEKNQSIIDTTPKQERDMIEPKSVSEAFGSGFFEYGGFNSIALKNELEYSATPTDTNYNPYKSEILESIPVETQDRYTRYIGQANSDEDLRSKLANIEKYQHYQAIADFDNEIDESLNNLAYFVGAVTGAVTDPVNVLSGGAGTAAKLYGLTAKIGSTATGIGAGVTSGLLYGASSATLSETTLAMDTEEKLQFAAITATSMGVLGGVIGKSNAIAARQVLQREGTELASQLQHEITKIAQKEGVGAEVTNISKNTGRLELEDFGFKGWEKNLVSKPMQWVADGSKYILGFISPLDGLVFKSFSRSYQRAGINSTGYGLKFKNLNEGEIVQNINDLTITQSSQTLSPVQRAFDDTFAKYKKAGGELSQSALREELHLAASTKKLTNNKILDDFLLGDYTKATKKNLQLEKDLGYIPQEYNPEGIYAHVEYDNLAIAADVDNARRAFGKKISDGEVAVMKKKMAESIDELRKLEIKLKKATDSQTPKVKTAASLKTKIKKVEVNIKSLRQQVEELQSDDYIDLLGDSFIDKINGVEAGARLHRSNKVVPKDVMKKRFTNTDGLEKYIKSGDILKNLAATTREINAAYHSKNIMGDSDWEKVFLEGAQEYKQLQLQTKADFDAGKITEKQLNKKLRVLKDQQKRDEYNLNVLKNRVYGKLADGSSKYSFSQTLANGLNTVVGISVGQSIALSQIPDLARIVYGMAKETSSIGMSNSTSAQVAKNLKNITVKEFQDSGIVPGMDGKILELALQDFDTAIRHNHSNLDILHTPFGNVEVNIGNLNDMLTKINTTTYALNAMTPVTIGTRYLGLNLSQRKLIRTTGELFETGKLSQENKNYFEAIGLSKDDAINFYKNVQKHGVVEENGMHNIRLDRWGTKDKTKFFTAMRTDYTNHWVSEPNIGTKPGILDNAFGMLTYKYKSFTVAAMRNYWLKSMQGLGAEEITVASMRVAMGSLSYILKQGAQRGFDKVETDPERLFYEGVMRSGAFAGADMAIQYGHALQDLSGGKLKTSVPYALGIYDERINKRFGGNTFQEFAAKEALGVSSVVFTDIGRLTKDNYTAYDKRRAESYFWIYGSWYGQMIKNNLLD